MPDLTGSEIRDLTFSPKRDPAPLNEIFLAGSPSILAGSHDPARSDIFLVWFVLFNFQLKCLPN